jgi:hypothetical protein
LGRSPLNTLPKHPDPPPPRAHKTVPRRLDCVCVRTTRCPCSELTNALLALCIKPTLSTVQKYHFGSPTGVVDASTVRGRWSCGLCVGGDGGRLSVFPLTAAFWGSALSRHTTVHFSCFVPPMYPHPRPQFISVTMSRMHEFESNSSSILQVSVLLLCVVACVVLGRSTASQGLRGQQRCALVPLTLCPPPPLPNLHPCPTSTSCFKSLTRATVAWCPPASCAIC